MIFTAPINTTIYGVDYLAGDTVDVDDWNRAQLLQMLDAGLIAPGQTAAELAGASYTHQQYAPASVWSITHPLTFTPNVTVVDTVGVTYWGIVTIIDPTHLSVTFSVPFSGSAYLS